MLQQFQSHRPHAATSPGVHLHVNKWMWGSHLGLGTDAQTMEASQSHLLREGACDCITRNLQEMQTGLRERGIRGCWDEVQEGMTGRLWE